MAGYAIEIDPTAAAKLSEWWVKNAEGVDALLGKVDELEKKMKGLRQSGTLFGGRGGMTLGGRDMSEAGGPHPGDAILERGRKGSGSMPLEYARGANSAVQRAEQHLLNANLAGDEAKKRDAEIALERARARKEKDEEWLRTRQDGPRAKSREELMMDAFMTSRIGQDGKLYPLVGKLYKAGLMGQQGIQDKLTGTGLVSEDQAAKLAPAIANAAKMAFPLLIGAAAVSGAAALAVGAYGLAKSSAANLMEGSRLYYGLGSSSRTTGIASTLARASGADPIAQSRQLGEALMSGTFGAAYMRQRGIADFGSRTVDKGENYVRAIDELRKVKSDREAIRIARDLGLEDQLWYRDLSENSYRRLKDGSMGEGSGWQRRIGAESNAQIAQFEGTWEKIKRAVAVVGAAGTNIGFEMSWRTSPLTGPLAAGLDLWDYLTSGKGDSAKSRASSADVTSDPYVKALNENTRALKDGSDRVGGGNYASGAIPDGWSSGWRREKLGDAIQNQALMMGAFTVN